MLRSEIFYNRISSRYFILICVAVSLLSLGAVVVVRAQNQSAQIITEPSALASGEILRIEAGNIRQITLSPDGSQLALATSAGLWLADPNAADAGQWLDRAAVTNTWWAPDSSVLAAGPYTGTVQLWQAADQRKLVTITTDAGAIVTLAWAPDSRQLATGTDEGIIEIWQATDASLLETLTGHTGAITSLIWSPDGSLLISTATDGAVRTWPVEAAPVITPTLVVTPTPTAVLAEAVVQTDVLNLRAGPGTSFERIATLSQGNRLTVTGQVDSCAWLQVITPTGGQGWVAGTTQYVTLSAACTTIPDTSQATTTPQAIATPLADATTPLAPTATAVVPVLQATPTPTAEAGATGNVLPAEQGCYLFQNQLGTELTVTMTRVGDTQSVSFQVPSDQETPYCLDAGRYTYTIDAPPPWASINGELDVKAGDRFLFPVRPQ